MNFRKIPIGNRQFRILILPHFHMKKDMDPVRIFQPAVQDLVGNRCGSRSNFLLGGTYGLGRPTIYLGMTKFVALETQSREGHIRPNRVYGKTKPDLGRGKCTEKVNMIRGLGVQWGFLTRREPINISDGHVESLKMCKNGIRSILTEIRSINYSEIYHREQK